MGKLKTIVASLAVVMAGLVAFGAASAGVQANQSNDVMYGGVHSVEAANKAMIAYPQLYAKYGVSKDLRVETGAAHRNGNITNAAGQVVATNGVSVGRQKLNSASRSFVADGNTWYESANSGPNVFLSESLPAYLYFRADGTFSGGIIMDCGNPLGGTNTVIPKTPGIKLEKTVDYVKQKTVNVGQAFTYNLRITNTGNVDLINAVITDNAPAGVTFTGASHGQVTAGGKAWIYTIDRLAAGSHVDYDIFATVPTYKEGAIINQACIDAREVPGSPDSCDKATVDVPKPVVKQVEVCEIATGNIVKVDDGYDTIKYSTNLDDCKPVTVCDTSTNTVITIRKHQMKDSYTTDQSKCGQMVVCVLETKEIKTIAKNAFDTTKMTTDQSKCAPAPTPPPTPQPPVQELPKTGVSEAVTGTIGLGALVAAGYAWLVSRRQLA